MQIHTFECDESHDPDSIRMADIVLGANLCCPVVLVIVGPKQRADDAAFLRFDLLLLVQV